MKISSGSEQASCSSECCGVPSCLRSLGKEISGAFSAPLGQCEMPSVSNRVHSGTGPSTRQIVLRRRLACTVIDASSTKVWSNAKRVHATKSIRRTRQPAPLLPVSEKMLGVSVSPVDGVESASSSSPRDGDKSPGVQLSVRGKQCANWEFLRRGLHVQNFSRRTIDWVSRMESSMLTGSFICKSHSNHNLNEVSVRPETG